MSRISEIVTIGRKNAIYLPRSIVRAIGLEEGEKVQLTVEGRTIRMEFIRNPLRLALEGRKFAKINPDQIEAISLEEQTKHAADPT